MTGSLSAVPLLINHLLGLDQRKLFIAAKEWLPKLGYREVRITTVQPATVLGPGIES